MSRQSDNSKAGSEGNGDSMLSSYQNSPRKTPEFSSAGPFGDSRTDNKSSNCYIFTIDNDSSPEREDQQVTDLKAEYFERLNLIRQKLANIDIANYGSYYSNCPVYSSSYSPRCKITEIFDDSPKDKENVSTETKLLSCNNEATVSKTDKDIEIIGSMEDKALQKEKRRKKSNYTDSGKSDRTKLTKENIENKDKIPFNNLKLVEESQDTKSVDNIENTSCINLGNGDFKNTSPENRTLPAKNRHTEDISYKNLPTIKDQKNIHTEKDVAPVEETKTKDLPCHSLTTKYDLSNKKAEQVILKKEEKNIKEDLKSIHESESNSKTVKNTLQVEDNQNIEDYMIDSDPPVKSNCELETIFKFRNTYDVDSAVELIDLNYNPPKKKYCLRDETPQLIMSDGAMSLPYHVRVSLHSEALKKKDLSKIEIDDVTVANKVKQNMENLDQTRVVDNTLNEERNSHIFPDIQVDCFGGDDQEETVHMSSEILHKFTDQQACFDRQKSAGFDNEYNVFYFETLEPSPLESVRSHRTIVTETTVSDSPSRKPKRRRLLLRSAQNKVKPIDRISLWEEIRTIEAINKQKQESSSSLESYFKDVITYKEKPETEALPADSVSVGDPDNPPKTKPTTTTSRFTKITKFCTSIFRKKSAGAFTENNTINEEPEENSNPNSNDQYIKKRVIEIEPKAAHMLLNLRKEQDLDVDIDESTPSIDNFSECTEVVDEDDSYYDGTCPICFCF